MTDDLDLSPAESLLFWAVLAIELFAVSGFVAVVLYSYF